MIGTLLYLLAWAVFALAVLISLAYVGVIIGFAADRVERREAATRMEALDALLPARTPRRDPNGKRPPLAAVPPVWTGDAGLDDRPAPGAFHPDAFPLPPRPPDALVGTDQAAADVAARVKAQQRRVRGEIRHFAAERRGQRGENFPRI